jgi:hydrogenase maturation protein HypF
MALEAVVDDSEGAAYPVAIDDAGDLLELDWRPLVAAVAEDAGRGVGPARIAARFHNALGEAVAELARRLVDRCAGDLPAQRAALTGGCFQNRRLTEAAAGRLAASGFEVLLHRRVPPNDGGIAYGQLAVAAARLAAEPSPTAAPAAV